VGRRVLRGTSNNISSLGRNRIKSFRVLEIKKKKKLKGVQERF